MHDPRFGEILIKSASSQKEESLDQFIERLFLGAGPSVLPASTLHTGPILRPTFELFAPVVEHTIILTF